MQLNTHAIVQAQEALKTVKGNTYEEYEKKIEVAAGAGGAVGGLVRRCRLTLIVSNPS